jgi:hypothetical protein
LPAGADAQHHPTPAHDIDGGRLVGKEGGMMDRARGNERAQLQPRRGGSESGQRAPTFERRFIGRLALRIVGHVVVGEPDPVPSLGFGATGEVENLGPLALE